MPKKKRPEEKPQDQFKRFIETANEHGVEAEPPKISDVFKPSTVRKPRSGSSRSSS